MNYVLLHRLFFPFSGTRIYARGRFITGEKYHRTTREETRTNNAVVVRQTELIYSSLSEPDSRIIIIIMRTTRVLFYMSECDKSRVQVEIRMCVRVYTSYFLQTRCVERYTRSKRFGRFRVTR